MYPLPVYLVGCPDDLRQDLAGPLGHAGAAVAGEVASADDAAGVAARGPAVMVVAAGPAAVRAVREAAPGCPVLALTDPAGFVPALEAGAAQAVMLPLEPGDLEAALGAIAEQAEQTPAPAAAPPASPPPAGGGRVIAVTGACGGAGATTIAVNLAVELADLGATVVLAEPTQPVGRLALFLDAHPAFTTADLLPGTGPVDARLALLALHPVTDRLKLLAAEYRVIPGGPAPAGAAARLVAAVRGAADVIVLDLPCTYDDAYFDALTGADAVVAVGVQRLPAVRALQMLVEVLHRAGREAEARVVVNQYDPGQVGFTAANIQAMLQGAIVGTVADDPRAVVEAVNAGRPLKAVAPKSPAREDIARLARSLVGAAPGPEPADDRTPPPQLLGRLARAFGLSGGAK
jgi:pilus assembly protein CpaE